MKKIKKSKKAEIEKLLLSFPKFSKKPTIPEENAQKFPEIFAHNWDFLNTHFKNSKYFYMLNFPEPPDKFRFKNCKFTKNPKDQIYDQVFLLLKMIILHYFIR